MRLGWVGGGGKGRAKTGSEETSRSNGSALYGQQDHRNEYSHTSQSTRAETHGRKKRRRGSLLASLLSGERELFSHSLSPSSKSLGLSSIPATTSTRFLVTTLTVLGFTWMSHSESVHRAPPSLASIGSDRLIGDSRSSFSFWLTRSISRSLYNLAIHSKLKNREP